MQRNRSRRTSTYATRRRWTREDARAALADLASSGQRLGEFATDAGIDPQRLSRWRRRLAASAEQTAFAEVVVPPPAPSAGRASPAAVERGWFEVVLVSGRKVRVAESFDAGALGRLLAVLDEGGAC